ncbi:ferredoxin [Pseudofrankia asymbiotica]|uniref:ferredoxin n=1 Tax=Pseudofrankia asymbiotica TaxID=1834516 RepID=UPI00097573AB|nr:ferredoxin [Pseudofrankia asymbiotica]
MTQSTEQTTGLRFVVDTDLCVGHGRCYTLAPQWFDCDDVGYAEIKDVVIGAGERTQAEDVAAACPEGAITLVEK